MVKNQELIYTLQDTEEKNSFQFTKAITAAGFGLHTLLH